MGDVIEIIVDGTSGLAPGGVEGSCLVAGCCSRGVAGRPYILGPRSDLNSILGIGPLVDALRDVFAAGGQNPVVVAVPVGGTPPGHITPCRHDGTGPEAVVRGEALNAADVVVTVSLGGAGGAAAVQVSKDGGQTYETAAVPPDGEVVIDDTGARLIFKVTEENPLIVGDAYTFKVVTAASQYRQSGPGPAIAAVGEPKAGGRLEVLIVKSGPPNTGTYKLSIDGGDNYGPVRTLPFDGLIDVPELGLSLELIDGEYQAGTLYSWEILPPSPTTAAVMEALAGPLEKYDVEFVYVVGPSDSVDWAAASALCRELWNRHRPLYFKFESRLPYAGESLSEWAASLIGEREGFASRYVQVIAAFGETSDSTGLSRLRSWGGLNAGKILSIPVHRAAGRVRDGAVSQATLPDGWNDGIQTLLESAGFVTAKRYAGLPGVRWGDSRTMAESTSDYQYEEVLRTTFKAFRKCRVSALKSLYDEAGGLGGDLANTTAGLAFLEAGLEAALNTMTKAVPPELDGYAVVIPPDQDIVNNGLAVELTFYGIPIIREITLYGQYVYAGGRFDQRREVWSDE